MSAIRSGDFTLPWPPTATSTWPLTAWSVRQCSLGTARHARRNVATSDLRIGGSQLWLSGIDGSVTMQIDEPAGVPRQLPVWRIHVLVPDNQDSAVRVDAAPEHLTESMASIRRPQQRHCFKRSRMLAGSTNIIDYRPSKRWVNRAVPELIS